MSQPFLPRSSARLVTFAIATAAVLASTLFAAAQSPDARDIDRARLLQPPPAPGNDPYDPITGTDGSHAAASPNDPDLGEQAILKREERYRPFTVSVAAPVFYTSNVALVRRGEEGDLLVAPQVGITFAPRITKTLFASFSLEQQQFYYSRFSALDFGSFDARAGLTYNLPQAHNLSLRAEYAFNRLTAADSFDAFFSHHALALTAELPFRIGRAQQVSLGTNATISLDADFNEARRHDFDGYVGYAANLTRSLTVSAVGRLVFRDYVEGDRHDFSEVLAVAATYRFTKWLSASATSTLAWNQSNQSVFDYNVANFGAAVAVSYRF